jgi:Tfp pilus assembly protein FimT
MLETLVVVAIMSLMALVSIPYFVRLSRRQRLVASAHEIQQSLLAARMRAVRANQNTSLFITVAAPGDISHELDVVAPDTSPAPTPTPVGRSFLPANKVEFLALPLNNKVTFSGDGRVIAPPGPTPGAIITVQGPVGATVMNQVTIRANPTGKIEVVTPVAWQ